MNKYSLPLTPRESLCLYFASYGLNTEKTAEKMQVSFETVKTYRSTILQKLQCKTMACAVRVGIEQKLF